MAPSKLMIIPAGIDGGDFDPHQEVKSGISRLVKSFMANVEADKPSPFRWFYYSFAKNMKTAKSSVFDMVRLPSTCFSSFFLPVRMLVDRVQVYLGFSGVLPGLTRIFRKKSIIFIHDLGFYRKPENYRDPARMKWQTEYAVYSADRVIVFSDYIKKQLFKRFPGLPENKVKRIYPGADHIKAGKKTRVPGYGYFLYVGVIKQAKNIETLLSRFFEFLNQTPDKRTKLILIGAREQSYFEKITNTALYSKLRDNLLFLDNVPDEELGAYYINSIGVLNVSFEEGFCYPVVEALQMGKHVIVNDIPLYREFVPHFGSIRICPEADDFVKEMIYVSKRPTPAQASTQKVFTWKNFTEELENVIKSLSI